MIIKLLIWTAIFFFLVRYINRLFLPSSKRNPFQNIRDSKRPKRRRMDQIEDAEFEDLTDTD
ncbi:MAG: hypothetical protein AAFW89_09895 [Bacteroidota bacterium]